MPWYTITDSFDKDFGSMNGTATTSSSAIATRCSAHTSSTTAATRRWGLPGATSTSRRSPSGDLEDSPEVTRRRRHTNVELARQLRRRDRAEPEVGRYNHRPSRSRRPKARRRGESMTDFTRDEPSHRPVVDRATFQAELDVLGVREKAHTREGEAIAAARRRCRWWRWTLPSR